MTDGIVTLLFTDLVGSTALLDELGDDDFDRLRRTHFRMLREQVSTAGGHEVKSLGDGLMVVVPSAVDAVRCAVEMQRVVAMAPGEGIEVRVGLHVGDPIRDEDDYFGRPVVVARRLCDHAEGGQILASSLVRDLVGSRGGFEFRALGDLELKGLSAPVTAFEVGWDRADASTPLAAGLARLAGEPFVGRDEALAALRHAWDAAAAGGCPVVLVAGEPGIGKTRLAAEIGASAHAVGATVLYGRCDEDALVPYQPFVEALGQLLAGVGEDRLGALLGDSGPDLARLLPDLPRRLRLEGAPPAGDAETSRYLMFEAVSAFLREATRRAPVLVVLDDLHWADAPTLRLLRHLVSHGRLERLLVVGTYRDTDLDRTHPLAGVLADLRRDTAVDRVLLGGLSEMEIARLLEKVSDQAPDEQSKALAAALHRETEGNPFFVREVLRHLVESGVLFQRDGRWTSDLTVADVGIPEGVRDVIGRRLSRLDAETNEVLGAAAVLGRDFGLADLAAITGVDGDELVTMLDGAVAAAVVNEVAGAIDGWSFTHALVRQTLIEEMTTSRRVRLHRRAVRAIEAGADAEARVAELAHHCIEAADDGDGRAVGYALRAGRLAMEALAWEEAVRVFDAALDMLDPEDGDPHLRAELLLDKGRALEAFGTDQQIRSTFDACLAAARTSGDPELLGEAAIAAAGPPEAGRHDLPHRTVLEDALATLGPARSAMRARVMARLAAMYSGPGVGMEADTVRAAALAEDAEAMVRAAGDAKAIVEVARSLMFIIAFVPGNIETRRRAAEELIEQARQVGDLDLEATGWGWVYECEMLTGDPAAAEAAIARFDEIAVKLRRALDRYWSKVWKVAVHLFTGRLDEAARMNDESFQEFGHLGHNGVISGWAAVSFVLRRWRGGLEELVPVVEAEVARGVSNWVPPLAYLYADVGRLDDARATIDHHLDLDQVRRDPLALLSFCLLAVTAETVGDAELGEAAFAFLAPYEGLQVEANYAVFVGSSSRFLGAAAMAAGRVDESVRLLRAAVADNTRMGGRPWVAEAQIALAAALGHRGRPGDIEEAAAAEAAALVTCEELGMPRLAAQVDRSL